MAFVICEYFLDGKKVEHLNLNLVPENIFKGFAKIGKLYISAVYVVALACPQRVWE